jgi:calcineurin-like phosphoesterase family protein
MDETIISNWNKVVGENDLVYHLGDFAFGPREDNTGKIFFENLFNRLNGLIVLIKGNHDSLAWKNRGCFYASYDSYHEIRINGQDITLCHYAMKIWNKSHRGAWHLYGHSHESLPDDKQSLSFDVGVDCHNYTPINFERVKDIMSKKNFKPIDHHGEK